MISVTRKVHIPRREASVCFSKSSNWWANTPSVSDKLHLLMIGRTLTHYKILSEISRGGMSVVYRALDIKLDLEVAIKVPPPELVADPERKRCFVQEARAAAR